MRYPGKGLEFPDKELQVGDSWDVHQSVEVMPGTPVDVKGKMTLTGTKTIDGKNYLVIKSDLASDYKDITMKTPAPAASAKNGAQPPQMSASGSMTEQGTTLFDEQTGEVFSFSATIKIDMQMTMSGDHPMTIPTKMTMDTQLTRAK